MSESSAKRVTRGFGTWNDGTQLSRPQGLCCIGRHVYVCDSESHVLRRFSAALLDNLEVVAGLGRSVWGKFGGDALGTSLTAPCGVFPGGNGEIFVTSSWDSMLWQIEGSHMSVKVGMAGSGYNDGALETAKLEAPTGGCYAADVNCIILVDSDEGRLRYISRQVVNSIGNGETATMDGTFSECSFRLPYAICRATHTLEPIFYVSEYCCIRIVRFQTRTVKTYAGSITAGFADGPRRIAQFRELKEIACAKDKTIFVADYGNERIRVISPGGIVSTLVGPLSSPSFLSGAISDAHKPGPVGLCLTPHGDLIFTQPKLNLVQVVHSVIDPSLVKTVTFNYATPLHPHLPLYDLHQFDTSHSDSSALGLPHSFLSIAHPNVLSKYDKFSLLVTTANLPMNEVAVLLSTESFPSNWSPTASINMLYIVKQCHLAPQFRNSLLVELEMRLNSVSLIDLLDLLTHVELHCAANKRLGSVVANAILIQISAAGMTELPLSLSAFGVGRFEKEFLAQLFSGVKFVPKAVKLADTHLRCCLERLYGATVSSQRLSADKSAKVDNELIASSAPCNFHILSHDGYAVPCHDWILFSRWPYFRHLVESGSEEWSHSKKIQIPADTFSRHTLRAFIKYIYTNRSDAIVNNDNVALEILLHAQRYNLADMSSPPLPHPSFAPLLSSCDVIFHQIFTLENCVDKYFMARDYGREAHQLRISLFIAEHFEALMKVESTRNQVMSLGPATLASIWVWVSGGPRDAF